MGTRHALAFELGNNVQWAIVRAITPDARLFSISLRTARNKARDLGAPVEVTKLAEMVTRLETYGAESYPPAVDAGWLREQIRGMYPMLEDLATGQYEALKGEFPRLGQAFTLGRLFVWHHDDIIRDELARFPLATSMFDEYLALKAAPGANSTMVEKRYRDAQQAVYDQLVGLSSAADNLSVVRTDMKPAVAIEWGLIPGGLVHVSCGEDGAVWGLSGDQRIWQWRREGWREMPGRLVQISVGNATAVWGVNHNDDVFRWLDGAWQQQPGKLKYVSAAHDGSVAGVNHELTPFVWRDGGWVALPGKLRQISIARADLIFGVNANDSIFQWTGSGWQAMDGRLRMVSAGLTGDGRVSLWGVASDQSVWWRGPGASGWTARPGRLAQVSASRACVAGVNANQNVFAWNRSDLPLPPDAS